MPDNVKHNPLLQMVPGFIRKDFVRKLMAVILASIIYTAVIDRLNATHEIPGIPVPVKAPPGFVIMEDGNPVIKVTVSGSQSLLKRLKPEDFSVSGVEINPEGYREGKPYVLYVSPENVHSPIGIKVVSVSPESFRFDIDKEESRSLPVEAVFDSKMPLPPGYAVTKVNVSPQHVRVTGPSIILEKLDVVKTEPISLDRITQSFDINTDVVISRPDIKVSPGKVLVQTEIQREFDTRTFIGLPIRIMKGKDNEDSLVDLYDVKLATVTVSAPSEILKDLTPGEIKAYIDISGFGNKGVYELELGCWVTDNRVEVKSLHPETVKVKIR